MRGPRMLAFLVLCVVLAISASYEFLEWGAALALGQGADEFLGTQGDHGTPSPTCSSRWSALPRRCRCCHACTTARSSALGRHRAREAAPLAHPTLIDPKATYVHLGRDGVASQVAGGDAFWSLPADKTAALGHDWLVSEFDFVSDWPTWEMHPHADEFVYVLSGSVELPARTARRDRIGLHARDGGRHRSPGCLAHHPDPRAEPDAARHARAGTQTRPV